MIVSSFNFVVSEITYGDVVIRDSKDLCYVDTVKWEDIFENQDQRAEVDNSTSCMESLLSIH